MFPELSAVGSCSSFCFLDLGFKSSGTLDGDIFGEIKYKKMKLTSWKWI